MSSSWETQERLTWERFEKLTEALSGENPLAPEVLEEQTVRLLATVLILLRQHHINKRGQCRFCGATRWTRRFWNRRRRCTVHQALHYALRESLDVVWWHVLDGLGRKVSLAEVRGRLPYPIRHERQPGPR